MLHTRGCILGVEGARNYCKKVAWPSTLSRDESKRSGPFIPRRLPRPFLLLSCTRIVVSYPRAQPMARERGPASQLNGGSGTEAAPPPKGRRPLATHEAGLFAVFAARRAQPSSADSLPPWPSLAERSRAQPNSSTFLPPPPERRRASELAAPAAEEAPPQGEEVPALRRPPAAEAGRVAPRRERRAEAARPRGRARGVDVAPDRLPPPPARRLSSLSRR